MGGVEREPCGNSSTFHVTPPISNASLLMSGMCFVWEKFLLAHEKKNQSTDGPSRIRIRRAAQRHGA